MPFHCDDVRKRITVILIDRIEFPQAPLADLMNQPYVLEINNARENSNSKKQQNKELPVMTDYTAAQFSCKSTEKSSCSDAVWPFVLG